MLFWFLLSTMMIAVCVTILVNLKRGQPKVVYYTFKVLVFPNAGFLVPILPAWPSFPLLCHLSELTIFISLHFIADWQALDN